MLDDLRLLAVDLLKVKCSLRTDFERFISVFVFQNAIANASSLAEVERLKGMLQAGQIPGRELRQGQC